jgi:hypothetical protein
MTMSTPTTRIGTGSILGCAALACALKADTAAARAQTA